MPVITIRIPDAHLAEISEAVVAAHGGTATLTGVRKHIIQRLREMVNEHQQNKAARETRVNFDDTWDDLEELR